MSMLTPLNGVNVCPSIEVAPPYGVIGICDTMAYIEGREPKRKKEMITSMKRK
jgi:hypothetical protein